MEIKTCKKYGEINTIKFQNSQQAEQEQEQQRSSKDLEFHSRSKMDFCKESKFQKSTLVTVCIQVESIFLPFIYAVLSL